MKLTLKYLLLSVLLLGAFVLPMSAQNTGTITGRASDASGAVIPGVAITLTSPAIMGTKEAVTDERGTYRFELLPTGTYALKFELPGFKILSYEGIQMTAGFTATINAALEVAAVGESITVSGQSPTIDLEKATVAVNFTSNVLANLPTGRDLWATLGLAPGVMVNKFEVGGSSAGTATSYRTYGTSGDNYTLVDGVIVVNQFGDHGSFEEVQVVAASKGADVATAGAFSNSIVKTGSNQLHGEEYLDWETPKLQGDNLTDRLKGLGLTNTNTVQRYNDFNFNVGGPFIKDKFWWFVSARKQYQKIFATGYTQGGCTTVATCTGKPLGTYPATYSTTKNADFWTNLPNATMKLNYQLNSNNQLIGMASWADKFQPFRGGFGSAGPFLNSDSVGRQTYPTWIFKGGWTSTVNSRITLDNSINMWRNHWPFTRRVDEYSIRDLDTQLIRGGFSGTSTGTASRGSYTENRYRWHFNSNLSLMTDKLITGTHNIKTGYMWHDFKTADVEDGLIGQVVQYYRGGFKTPAFIDTFDFPFTNESSMRQQSLFINDTWNITRKLTVNLGLRYERTTPYYREQVKPGTGPYQTKQVFPARDIVTMNGLVPRLSAVYDLFGNGRTAIKTSYGRYLPTVESGVAQQVNPITVTRIRYVWDGAMPFDPTGKSPTSVTGGVNRDIDPNFKFSYYDEYTAELDQQLVTNLSLRAGVVRKFEQNNWQNFNIAIPYSAYSIPVSAVDPGRDGVAGTADDVNRTVWGLQQAFVGKRQDVYRNNPMNDAANTTIETSIVKRFSNKWQMITGFDYLFHKSWGGAVPEDPNNLVYNAGERYGSWTYKLLGTYQLPYKVTVSSVFRAGKGTAYGRRWNSPSLPQGVQTVTVEPKGTFYTDTVKLLDIRAEKVFTISERWGKVSALFDLFNTTNSAAVTAINDLTGAKFLQPTETLTPRIVRLGMKYNF